MGVLLGVEQSCLNFSRVCLPSLVNATFKNLMCWHTCFLSLLYKNVVLPAALGLPNISQVQHIFSIFFDLDAPFSFPLFHIFIRSLHDPSAHSTFKPWERVVPTPTLWMGGDLWKGCRGTLDHVKGSPQGCNILFCHAHKAKMPLSQWTWTYNNVMSQSSIKKKWSTKKRAHCKPCKLANLLILGSYRDSREHKDLATLQECQDHLEWTRMFQFMVQVCIMYYIHSKYKYTWL